MIYLNNISYSYPTPQGTSQALDSVTAQIRNGAITAIIGRTGSGKSTLSEIISGLTSPQSGTATIDGDPIKEYQNKIGMVFQYPEYQLFAETVYDDIAYGPKNKGLCGKDLDDCIQYAIKITGLKETLLSEDPFDLSGGEKRLTALAGILAMRPSILILDEPAAGLDPKGRAHMFEIIHDLITKDPSMTIVFVTHSMEDAAEFADDIIVLNNGSLAAQGPPEQIFNDTDMLSECGLDIPESVQLANELRRYGVDIGDVITMDDTLNAIINILEGGDHIAS